MDLKITGLQQQRMWAIKPITNFSLGDLIAVPVLTQSNQTEKRLNIDCCYADTAAAG